MKIVALLFLVALSACARPLQPMIRLNENETVTQICASSDALVIGSSLRMPFDARKGVELEPAAQISVFKNNALITRKSVGPGVIRYVTQIGTGFVGARVTVDQSANEQADFYMVADARFTQLPSLRASLVGILAGHEGKVIAYGYREIWELDVNEREQTWRPLGIDRRIVADPIRAIVRLSDEHFAIVTSKQIIGVPTLVSGPEWIATYQGQFVSAIGLDKCWVLTSEEHGAKVGYVDGVKGTVVAVGEIPDLAALRLVSHADELLVLASGRGGRNAERGYFRLNTKEQKLSSLIRLPDRTMMIYAIGNRLIFATNVGEIFEEPLP